MHTGTDSIKDRSTQPMASDEEVQEVCLDNGEVFVVEDDFQYLGSIIENNGSMEAELRARIGKATRAFCSVKMIEKKSVKD